MNKPLLAAYRYTSNNWAIIQKSKICGCCNCVRTFPPEEIVGWSGLDVNNMDDPKAIDNQTAMCPRCGSEAVLGDRAGYPIDVQFLSLMNEAWLQKTVIHRPKPKTGV